MLFIRKKQKQHCNTEMYRRNVEILNMLENTPILSKSVLLNVVVKKNVLHYYSSCSAYTKNLKNSTELQAYFLRKEHLKENKTSICLKCLSVGFILNKTIANPWSPKLAHFANDLFTMKLQLGKTKEQSVNYDSIESFEELYKNYQQYSSLKNTLDIPSGHIKTFFEFRNLFAAEKQEIEVLDELLEEAETLCKNVKEYLESLKAKKLLRTAFLKEEGFSGPYDTDTILYGTLIYQSKQQQALLLDKLTHDSAKVQMDKGKLVRYYQLIEITIASQIPNRKTNGFAILLPDKAAKEIIMLWNKYAGSPGVDIGEIHAVKDFAGLAGALTESILQTAYALWEANGFTTNSYEKVLEATLLLQQA